MVGVVQLVERQVVILNVAGSSPVTHPTGQRVFSPSDLLLSLPRVSICADSPARPRRRVTFSRATESGHDRVQPACPTTRWAAKPSRSLDQPLTGRQGGWGKKGGQTGTKYGGGSFPTQKLDVPPFCQGTLPRPAGVLQ